MPPPLPSKPPSRLQTTSGIPVDPVYTPEHLRSMDLDADLGLPGQYPFTRGIQPGMYRDRLWTMRQYAGMGDAEESNQRYKFLLANGTSGLSVAFDLPTQIGYDSDSPLALGEVGRVGVTIDSLEDMQRLFADIPLDRISTSMTINATAAILLALYVATAKRSGAPIDQLSGTIQNDILKEYIARGTYIYPIPAAMRLVTDTFAWTAEHLPRWNPISISGYHMREAGATAAQELAFTLANGITYVQSALDAGLDIDAFGPRLSFFFNAHSDLFEEVAKFRAARRMWARIMRDRFQARSPRSWALRFHAQTAGSTLTAQQPHNNIVRTTIEALAAVLGGTQSLHTNGFDEALALPTEDAARTALRTQQILAHESGVATTVDPLAGSYFVESLTNQIEDRAQTYLDTIAAFDASDSTGQTGRTGPYGMLRAIERGYIQQEIQNAAYAHQRAVDSGEQIIVGVNAFTANRNLEEAAEETTPTQLQRIDPALEARQIERLRALRLRRDPARHSASLRSVTDAARAGSNLMPHILTAVEADATVGEIADVLRSVFGEYHESVTL
ncbi:MAG TPA: methylmalonyl-CoA mutase family protein [Granulicella sp.]|jgi:methylmalonyl-CoA mutase N-terminal domain/subunit|nr:methylmalonyl-CoA mutase family protein [Granulicella sp.]